MRSFPELSSWLEFTLHIPRRKLRCGRLCGRAAPERDSLDSYGITHHTVACLRAYTHMCTYQLFCALPECMNDIE